MCKIYIYDVETILAMMIHWTREAFDRSIVASIGESDTISHDKCHYVLTRHHSYVHLGSRNIYHPLPLYLPTHSSPPTTQSQQPPRTTLNTPWPPQTTPSAAPAPPPTPHSSQAPTSTPSSAAPFPPPTPRHPSFQTQAPSTPSADPPT